MYSPLPVSSVILHHAGEKCLIFHGGSRLIGLLWIVRALAGLVLKTYNKQTVMSVAWRASIGLVGFVNQYPDIIDIAVFDAK